jgi:hypothetical protein
LKVARQLTACQSHRALAMLPDLVTGGIFLLAIVLGSIFWVKVLGLTDRLSKLEHRAREEDRNR